MSGTDSQSTTLTRLRLNQAATRALRASDVRMATLIKRIGPYTPELTTDPFTALVGSIVHQQVSLSAAAAVLRRLRDACPRRRVTPPAILALDQAALRGAGVSRQKARYLHDLAAHFADRRLTPAKLRRMSDDEVIDATTRVVGIGRWTAEMLLIFCLERPDVWPVDDLGLRRALQYFMKLDELPEARDIAEVGEPWRPYRTYATWYLWRSLEALLPPAIA
ncbi:MAG: DNA-3-methyladenine glycosylase 2 family protein [Phycisphaerae bacterium]|nr:DNA-3-methyladenine glycosylase 2 family protein [Phycisphaerae bacterium]